MWLLYILSYRRSVQLVHKGFSVVVVLHLSCNFDMVVEGGEHSIYLLRHLDWNPPVISSSFSLLDSETSCHGCHTSCPINVCGFAYIFNGECHVFSLLLCLAYFRTGANISSHEVYLWNDDLNNHRDSCGLPPGCSPGKVRSGASAAFQFLKLVSCIFPINSFLLRENSTVETSQPWLVNKAQNIIFTDIWDVTEMRIVFLDALQKWFSR